MPARHPEADVVGIEGALKAFSGEKRLKMRLRWDWQWDSWLARHRTADSEDGRGWAALQKGL